jgi:hypothetical protein
VPLLEDVGDVGDAAGGDQQRHVAQVFVEVLQQAFEAGAGEARDVSATLANSEMASTSRSEYRRGAASA